MSAIGSWKVTVTTPVGPQDMILHIDTFGDAFTGRIESAMGNHPIAGTVAGGLLNWQMKATKPIPITVTFKARIDNDRLEGSAKLGLLGKSTLSGERLRQAPAPAVADEDGGGGNITAESVDARYSQPYVDVNELRQTPVPHRYVHGGFSGTGARFSFYFPPKAQYQGRFFHNTYPMALSEDIGPFPIAFEVSTGNLPFTFDSGAYYVQTNLGGDDRAGGMADPAIAAYRVNAAAAKYSRVIAQELYGAHRAYGYLFGGSGGSYQVVGSAENTHGVWDGFVPFVMATPNAIPSMFTVRMHALRVLRKRGKFADIMDAINPGGSGDPYATLNAEEAAALKEATRMGFPPRGWWAHETLDSGYFSQVAPLMPMLDPGYADDFWNLPGYLGKDDPSLAALRFTFETSVTGTTTGFPRQLTLAEVPQRDFADAHLHILSGASAGKQIPIASINGNVVGFAYAADQSVANGIRSGDRVCIDNRWALALQTYHRHQLPDADLYGWNQFRKSDGQPMYPQREMLIGPLAAAGTAGAIPNGRISGKMLLLECLMDIDALAWQADWYRGKVRECLGEDFEEQFALWFIDHAQHDNPQTPQARAHVVSFEGALQQALRDISAWVETGRRPASTRYKVEDSQVQVPADARERLGIQPLIELHVGGQQRTEARIGQDITFTAQLDLPPEAGSIIALEWDFEGRGDFSQASDIAPGTTHASIAASHAYDKAGTYFAVARVTSQRQGRNDSPYGRIQNLARLRVIVR